MGWNCRNNEVVSLRERGERQRRDATGTACGRMPQPREEGRSAALGPGDFDHDRGTVRPRGECRSLGEEFGDRFGFDELAGLVEVIHDHGGGVDAEGVVDGGEEFAGVDGVFNRSRAGFVGGAVDVAAFDAGTSKAGGVTVGPMVAAVGAVAVAGGADAFLRAAAKLADGDDEGFVEEPAGVEVGDEGGEAGVEHGARLILHALGEVLVVVPGVVVGVGVLGPDDFDDFRAGLDEAAGEEAALAEGVAAVVVADFFRFVAEGEGVTGAAGDDELEGAGVVLVEVVALHGLVDGGHLGVDGVAEFGAAAESGGEDVGAELEVVDFDVRHFFHVHVITGWVERVGIEGLAEEAGGAAFADHVALLEGAGEHDEGEHGLVGGAEADDVRSEVGEVFRAGWFELAGGADLVGGVAGHHLVDGGGVVEESVGGVGHRPDHGDLVVDLGELGEDFGEVDAGDLGGDRLEGGADVVGDVFFGIPEVEVAGAALEVDHDDAFGLSPTGAVAGDLVGCFLGGLGLHLER